VRRGGQLRVGARGGLQLSLRTRSGPALRVERRVGGQGVCRINSVLAKVQIFAVCSTQRTESSAGMWGPPD